MKLVFGVLLLLVQSDTFNKLTYCKEMSRGPYESQCVELNSAGRGLVRFKRRGAEAIKTDIALSPSAKERFLAAVAATDNLEQADSYESNRKVADLGKKRLTMELPSGNRDATYNYSVRPEVITLGNFFDGVINEETIAFEVDTMLQFDKLGIPKKLELIGNELKSNRIADPERLIPILEKIQADQRLVNYARAIAGKMKEEIAAKRK